MEGSIIEGVIKMKENESNAVSGARAIAVVLVVIGHAIVGDMRAESSLINFIWSYIYSFHMYFFFFVSGMLFEKNIYKYEKNKKRFIKGKFNLLIIPYIAITLIEYISLFIGNFVLHSINKEIQIAKIGFIDFLKALVFNIGHFDTHLWYIYLLFFIFVFNIFLLKKKIPVLLILGLVMLVFGYPYLSNVPWKFQSMVYYMVPFVIGRICFKKSFLRKSIEQSKGTIVAYLICMGLINVIIYYLENIYTKNLFGIPGLRIGVIQNVKYITGFLGSILLVYCGHKLMQCSFISIMLKRLNKYSYEIYLYHQPFITAGCSTILLMFKFPTIIIIILSVIIGVAFPIAVSKFILRRSKILSNVFLGGH